MNAPAYSFKGKNLTTLVLNKIALVTESIAAEDGLTFEEAYRRFVSSRAYRNLTNTNTRMWGESVPFIVDDYRYQSPDSPLPRM